MAESDDLVGVCHIDDSHRFDGRLFELAEQIDLGSLQGSYKLRGHGCVAITMATINVIGGFMVTDRMLSMFRKR